MHSNSRPKQSFASKTSIWCRKRTNTEKRLLWITIIGILLIIILLIVLGFTLDHIAKKGLVCSTPSCIHAASTILRNIDKNIDPCEDFYEFACGTYLKTTTIPEDKTRVSALDQTSELVVKQLQTLIQESIDTKASKQYHLLAKLYNLCMNVTAIENDGFKTIKIILKELGGCPVLEGQHWNEGNFDWKKTAFIQRKIGFDSNHFIELSVVPDSKNASRHIITLDQPVLSLSREFLIKGTEEALVKAYYNYMVDIAVIFGANKDSAVKEMNDVLQFEISLAKISLPKEERRNSTELYNPMTIDDLQYNYPTVNWQEYIFKVLDVPDVEINDDEVIVVATPRVITDILDLLKRTPKRVQANYIMKRSVSPMLVYLNEEVRKRQLEYSKALLGTTEKLPRWKECTYIAATNIHLAAGALYVRKHFDLEAKKIAEDMVERIRAEFVKILKGVDWMDEKTRSTALAKAKAIKPDIGFPVEILDDRKVETFYSNLELDTDNYLKSIMQVNLFAMDVNYKHLRKPVDNTDWYKAYPVAVNAYYMSSGNKIEFPAGILQGIFFNKDRPQYLNYGAIGSVIGHEITHGFDDEGRQYDEKGNLYDWWDEETTQAFINKSRCIIEQYGNYTVPEINIKVNGVSTQGENIADNGGIKEAYLAYQSWVKENGIESKLPGLDYSPNQLFWISAANLWCTKTRNEFLMLAVIVGLHSSERFRVIGPMSNMDYFAKDFSCRSGSKMNPEHKCQVW